MFERLHGFFILMVIGLMGLLTFVVLNDIYRSVNRNIPMSYDVIVLLKMAACGVLGAIAGYLAKQDKSDDQED